MLSGGGLGVGWSTGLVKLDREGNRAAAACQISRAGNKGSSLLETSMGSLCQRCRYASLLMAATHPSSNPCSHQLATSFFDALF